MLIVKTPDGSVEHADAEDWTTTPDEHLVLLGADTTGAEQASNPRQLAEYGRGAWNSVERGPQRDPG